LLLLLVVVMLEILLLLLLLLVVARVLLERARWGAHAGEFAGDRMGWVYQSDGMGSPME
jgi:hypothetical protein